MQFVFKLTILKIWYMYIRLYDYVSWIDFVDTEKLQLHCVHHFRRIRWVYSASRFSNCTRPNVRSDDLIRIEHNWIRLFLVNSHTLFIAFNHVYYKKYKVIMPCRFWLSSVQCTKYCGDWTRYHTKQSPDSYQN